MTLLFRTLKTSLPSVLKFVGFSFVLSCIYEKIPQFCQLMFRSSMSIINNVLSKVLGSHNDRLIKKYNSQVNKINSLEEHMKSLSDSDLSLMTDKFKESLNENETVREHFARSVRTSKRSKSEDARPQALRCSAYWRHGS